jgi:hypothetical protein
MTMEEPIYGVLVERVDEDVRDWAYAAAHRNNYWTTEYWEEETSAGSIFKFKVLPAALGFLAQCKLNGVDCKGAW